MPPTHHPLFPLRLSEYFHHLCSFPVLDSSFSRLFFALLFFFFLLHSSCYISCSLQFLLTSYQPLLLQARKSCGFFKLYSYTTTHTNLTTLSALPHRYVKVGFGFHHFVYLLSGGLPSSSLDTGFFPALTPRLPDGIQRVKGRNHYLRLLPNPQPSCKLLVPSFAPSPVKTNYCLSSAPPAKHHY